MFELFIALTKYENFLCFSVRKLKVRHMLLILVGQKFFVLTINFDEILETNQDNLQAIIPETVKC